jgi:Uma2 family endonuclease
MSAGTVEVHKLTIPEFHALEPFLDPDRRHELLDGQIIVMPIPGNPHSIALNELNRQFVRQERPGLYVSLGGLRVDERTELLPDLCLLEQKPSGPDNPPAGAAKLVVEVAHTTLAYDTEDKLRAYRQAGVPEYWVVDVQGRRLLRYLAPEYDCQTFAGSQTPLRPQAYPDVAIDVGALFS